MCVLQVYTCYRRVYASDVCVCDRRVYDTGVCGVQFLHSSETTPNFLVPLNTPQNQITFIITNTSTLYMEMILSRLKHLIGAVRDHCYDTNGRYNNTACAVINSDEDRRSKSTYRSALDEVDYSALSNVVSPNTFNTLHSNKSHKRTKERERNEHPIRIRH